MRWTLKTIFYCHVETFAYKPSINSKKENSLRRSKLAIIHIWENPKYIMVLTKKKKKLDQSVACSEFLISRFISHTNCRYLKSLYKKIMSETELGCHPQKKVKI